MANALTNPILENYFIDESPIIEKFNFTIEISFLPGVTDNASHTVKEMAGDLFKLKEGAPFEVYTSKIFLLSSAIDDVKMAASPTTFGKEMKVFTERLKRHSNILKNVRISAKLNGATGNYNAHVAAYPNIDWVEFSEKFIENFNKGRL